MRVDDSAARLFLSYVDGEATLEEVWDHPAYDIAREHAGLLGGDLSADHLAVAGEDGTPSVRDNRAAIEELLDAVRDAEPAWLDRITARLEQVVPGAETGDLPVYLGIGYETGIGLADGVYLDVSEPFYLDEPRRVSYAALHESTHVCYDRRHDMADRMADRSLDSADGQRRFFEILFHTEAYAVYAAGQPWRADGVGGLDHPMCEDYRVLADADRLRDHVAQYDSFRAELATDAPLSRETLFGHTFGGPRLPYRVGCAMLQRIEAEHGNEAVREAFTEPPETFVAEYDHLLDAYRT